MIRIWSIPIPFTSWAGAPQVVDALVDIVTGKAEPAATVERLRRNDGFNCTW